MTEETSTESGFNPYATPTSAPPPILPAGNLQLTYAHDGPYLYVRDGAVLPLVCPVSNEVVEPDKTRKVRTLAWTPLWVVVLLFVNILVLLIVALILQKKAKVTYGMSEGVRRKIARKRSLGFVLLFGGIGLILAAVSSSNDTVIGIAALLAFLMILFSLIVFVVTNPLKAVKHRAGWLKIKGCSPEFLATLPLHPEPF